ncbi:MAG: S8 family serine peptidase [Verrucomicrobiaceae bacterium]|nr:S8 family serine peptidase [Verrucomicrobiaceae bacterium]
MRSISKLLATFTVITFVTLAAWWLFQTKPGRQAEGRKQQASKFDSVDVTSDGVVAEQSNIQTSDPNERELDIRSMARAKKEAMTSGKVTKGRETETPGSRDGRPWAAIDGWEKLTPQQQLEQILARPFGIMDNGKVSVLKVALDELYIRQEDDLSKRLLKIAPQPDAASLLREATKLGYVRGKLAQLVFYPPNAERNEMTRRILSDQVLLESAAPAQAASVLRAAGVSDAAEMRDAPGFVLGHDNRFPGAALTSAAAMERAPGIAAARPLIARTVSRRFVPNDPLFSKQWHLKQAGSNHANVSTVWDTNRGAGVTIGIIDDGVQLFHPDLAGNADTRSPTLHLDIVGGDTDPRPAINTPNDDSHGTAVAGLAVARGNNGLGVAGVAPEANLVGIRLTAGAMTAAEEVQAFNHRNDVIHVKNNSWGPVDASWVLGTADPLVTSSFANVAATGRGGLGTIIAFAAGNGRDIYDQSNKDAYANNIHTFAIAALTKTGAPAYYSEFGSNLIASAPADGVTTTDLVGADGYTTTGSTSDYTGSFNGTSAACPVATGVIALILKANPNLGWRDVKEILLRSGTKVAPTDAGWKSRTGGQPDLPQIKHNEKYGGGMVNAGAATALAQSWTNLGPKISRSVSNVTSGAILDAGGSGLTKNFDFSSLTPMRVEMVEIRVDISHTYRGDLDIQLISPGGVISNLVTNNPYDGGEDALDPDDYLHPSVRGFHDWTFTSVRHWGESSLGVWKLVMRDRVTGDFGTFHDATITIHGQDAPPVAVNSISGNVLAMEGEDLTLTSTSSGFPVITHQWALDGTNVSGATGSTLSRDDITFGQGGDYTLKAANVTGSASAGTKVAVIRPSPGDVIVNVGKTLTLATAVNTGTGQTVSYRWHKNGNLMSNDPVGPNARISGVDRATLTILRAEAGDTDDYSCEVTVDSLAPRMTPVSNVVVRFKPEVLTAAFPTDLIVSRAVNIPLNILNGSTSVVISGLPSGLTYDKVTGTIRGTPNVDVTNLPIKIKATNPAGTSDEVTVLLTIARLPDLVQGRFDGLFARVNHIEGGGNSGGRLSNLLISKTGSFSGKLQIAQNTHSFTGRLITDASADPTAVVPVSRGRSLPKVELTFTIQRSNGRLTGQVTDSPGAAWMGAVEAWRTPYSKTSPVAGVLGVHNFWAAGTATDAAIAPQGPCTGSMVVAGDGTVAISLKTGDGVSATSSMTVGPLGEVGIFAMLYSNKGSIRGNVQIHDQVAPALNTVDGTLTWNKAGPINASDRTYASGFDFGVGNANTMSATGGEYVKPLKSTPPTFLWGVPDVAVGLTNAKMAFTGTAIEGNPLVIPSVPAAEMLASINRTFRINGAHLATFASPNLAALKVTINASNGTFTGSAALKDGVPAVSRALSFGGVIANGQTKGRGWFKVVRVPLVGEKLTNAPIHSGVVEMTNP